MTDDRFANLRALLAARLPELDEDELAEALSGPDPAAVVWADGVDPIYEAIEELEARLGELERSLRRH